MAIEGSEIQYLMEMIRGDLPDLADELEAEFREGRTIIDGESTTEVPYTQEEQLESIRGALITLAETMHASRTTLARFADRFGLEPEIEFSDDGRPTDSLLVDLLGRSRLAQEALETVHRRLGYIERGRER